MLTSKTRLRKENSLRAEALEPRCLLAAVEYTQSFAASPGYEIEWCTQESDLRVRLTADATGWLGVGFNDSPVMPSSDVVMATGEGAILDALATRRGEPAPDASQDVTLVEATQVDGVTTIEFTRPLTTTDITGDYALTTPRFLVWALNEGLDAFTEEHTNRGASSSAINFSSAAACRPLVTTLPTVTVSDVQKVEGNAGTTNFAFTVTLSEAVAATATIQYTTVDGTATAGEDYVATQGSLTFPVDGVLSKNVLVVVNGDTTLEPDETFSLQLSNPVQMTIADGEAIATITNDDTAPLPTLSIADLDVTEGNSGTTTAQAVVTLAAASTQTVTVDYTTVDETAAAGADYVAKSGTLTFAPGETTATIDVVINGDTAVEVDEILEIRLENPAGATLAKSLSDIVILNDDVAPSLTLSIADLDVTEGNSGTTTAQAVVTLSAASTETVTVDYTTVDETAAAGVDYVAKSGTLTFAPGQTTATIDVVINGDMTVEVDEILEIRLANPIGATLAKSLSDIVILNDDVAPSLTLSIADLDVTEGDSGTTTAQAVVTLSAASAETVTVDYTTVDETAAAGVDFVAKSGTLTFAPGQTTATIDVVINGDTTVEVDEILEVSLANPVGATLAKSLSDIVILNDDSTIGAAWQNPSNALDVSGDGNVVPLDVLLVINRLNQLGSGVLPTPSGNTTPPPYFDVNGDGSVSPIDALLIINFLNNPTNALAAVAAAPESAASVAGTGGVSATDKVFSVGNVAADAQQEISLIASATQGERKNLDLCDDVLASWA